MGRFRTGDEFEGVVTDFGMSGEGIVKDGAYPVFVPFAIVGEKVRVRIVHAKKDYAFGELIEVLTPSNERVKPRCRHFGRCGGCDLQHLSHDMQEEVKRASVERTMKKAGIDVSVPACVSGAAWAYRNKLALPFGKMGRHGKIVLGFFEKKSHRVVPLKDCPLHGEWAAKVVAAVTGWANECGLSVYDEGTGKGLLRHVVARYITTLSVVIVLNGDDIPHADVLAAEAGLEQAKVNLSYTRVLAPFDGWISFKKYSAGNMVGPTSGVLATVVRNGDVKIYFSISEMDMLRLLRSYPGADRNADKKGPEVEIDFQDGVKYEYPGRISAWNNAISDGTGTFRLQAVAKNPDRKLFPGMYVRVKIRVEPYSRQIMIRNEAIMREQLGNFVFVVNKDNKIERRKVTLGGKNGGYYAVREGLKKGERIVIAGLQKAQPGSIVTPIANKEQAPDGSATPVANAK